MSNGKSPILWIYDHAPTRWVIVGVFVVAWFLAIVFLFSDIVQVLAARPWWEDLIVAMAAVAVPVLDRREQRLNGILLKDCNLVGIASFQVSLHYLFYFIYGCAFPLDDNPRTPIIPVAAAPVSDTALIRALEIACASIGPGVRFSETRESTTVSRRRQSRAR